VNVDEKPGTRETWSAWTQLLHKCWKEDPKERPTFDVLHKELQSWLEEQSKTLGALRDIGKLSRS
jgi:hypothetical protein